MREPTATRCSHLGDWLLEQSPREGSGTAVSALTALCFSAERYATVARYDARTLGAAARARSGHAPRGALLRRLRVGGEARQDAVQAQSVAQPRLQEDDELRCVL